MPSTLANHDVVPQSNFMAARACTIDGGWWESQNVVVAALTLTLPGSIQQHIFASPFSYTLDSWGSASSAHHLGLKRAKAQALPHINPRLTAKGSRKSLIAEPSQPSRGANPATDSQSSCPDLRNPSLSRLFFGVLVVACANMGGPKSIRTAEGIPLLSADMVPTTCCLWS